MKIDKGKKGNQSKNTSETNREKMKKVGRASETSCFAISRNNRDYSSDSVIKTKFLRIVLKLVFSDSVKTSSGSFDTNRVSYDSLRLRIGVITVVSHPKL